MKKDRKERTPALLPYLYQRPEKLPAKDRLAAFWAPEMEWESTTAPPGPC